MADVIILAVLAVLLVLAVRYILIHNFGFFAKNKDQKPSCGSACAGCSGCGMRK